MIRDDMIFEPYKFPGEEWEESEDGYQALLPTSMGEISVRFDGRNLFTSKEKPYEVWYPNEDTPIGGQTADDIFNWIKEFSKISDIEAG